MKNGTKAQPISSSTRTTFHDQKVSKEAGSSPILRPKTSPKQGPNKVFKMLRQVISSGIVNPSQYGINSWHQAEFGKLPSKTDIQAWQTQLVKLGIIEPVVTSAGKQSYKLKVS